MSHKKMQYFSPWDMHEEQVEKIPMMTITVKNNERSDSIVTVTRDHIEQNPSSPLKRSIEKNYIQYVRKQYSYRQKSLQKKQKIELKKIEMTSLMGIGKNISNEITSMKKVVQKSMIKYLLMIYIMEELKNEQSAKRQESLKQKYDCLFPLIGMQNINRVQYKNNKNFSLNDLISARKV